MNSTFNNRANGICPEQTRAALSSKTMVEKEQIVPVFKPEGIDAQQVDRIAYQQKLADEKQRARRVQQYQQQITEIHTRIFIDGQLVKEGMQRNVIPIHRHRQLTNDFNVQSAMAYERKAPSFSY